MSNTIFSLKNITKGYAQGKARLDVIKNASLDIKEGEIVALIGPSGSGKSTLLQVAGLLDNADSGEITIAGKNCTKMRDKERTRIRRDHLGFVYQFHHLLPEFTALENVAMPLLIAGKPRKEALAHAEKLLVDLGLKERLKHHPSQLSGGEQQRVAIGRALANSPLLLLADEPTGNLDPSTADHVFSVLLNMAKERGQSTLLVTHNHELARHTDRVVTLEGGHLAETTA